MCQFFSFVTDPENYGGKRFYFDWKYRKNHLGCDNHDSHSSICKHYKLDEDKCNKYEFNPLTKVFEVDQINSVTNDSSSAEDWVNKLDFKRIVKPLIVKPIINPLKDIPLVTEITDQHKRWLKDWASVWTSVLASVGDSVLDSVWDSVGASVWASVGDSVWASVRDSVGATVWASVAASVGAYASSFIDIEYKFDYSPLINLWESGLVPSFDGKTWRLHSGENAKIVYELKTS